MSKYIKETCYIGTCIDKGEETPGGMPRIIDDEVFERVQRILDKNRYPPA